MKKLLKKTLTIVMLVAYLFTLVPVNLLAREISGNYNDGDVIDGTKTVGDSTTDGGVSFTKTVSKTDIYGQYQVTLTAKGKNKTTTTSTSSPVYIVVVFDKSGSMENVCVGGITGNFYGKGSGETCTFSSNELKPFWKNAVNGAKLFATSLLSNIKSSQIALVTFSNSSTISRNFSNSNLNSANFGEPSGGTNIAAGLNSAKTLLDNAPSNAKKYVVMIGDGVPEVTGDEQKDIDDTIISANNLKNSNVEIFTIGYESYYGLSSKAESTLKLIATDANHYSNANASSIADSFTNISKSITVSQPAGTDATITDIIGDGFEYVSSNDNPIVDDKKVEFNIGDVTEEGKSVSFIIKAKDGLLPGIYETNNTSNNGVRIDYTNTDGKDDSKIIENSSEVYLNPDYKYTVNYYLENTNNNPIDTKSGVGKYNDTVKIDVADKKGYKYNGIKSFVIDEDNKVINVVYEKDENQTKTLKYKVKYFLDNLFDTEEEDSKNVWVNDADTLEFNNNLLNKTYIGYKLKNTDPENILINYNNKKTSIVNDKEEIKVCYEKDESQTKELKYTVEYYIEGIKQDNDTEERTKTVWINAPEELEFDSSLVDNDKYVGYKIKDTDPVEIGETVTNNKIIKVNYEKDSFDYTINYYKDSKSEDNYLGAINGTEKYESEVNVDTTKYLPEGYEYTGEDIVIIIDTENNKVNVIYTEMQITYKVHIIIDGNEKDVNDITLPYSTKLNDDLFKDDKYDNYDFDKIEYLDGNIVNVYYRTKISEYVKPPKTGIDYLDFVLLFDTILVGLFFTKKKLG